MKNDRMILATNYKQEYLSALKGRLEQTVVIFFSLLIYAEILSSLQKLLNISEYVSIIVLLLPFLLISFGRDVLVYMGKSIYDTVYFFCVPWDLPLVQWACKCYPIDKTQNGLHYHVQAREYRYLVKGKCFLKTKWRHRAKKIRFESL